MEKIEDVDVIIFSCATLTLTFAVDMLSNEKANKSKIEKRGWKIGFMRGMQKLRLNDHENFRKYLRMNTDTSQVALITFLHLRHEH